MRPAAPGRPLPLLRPALPRPGGARLGGARAPDVMMEAGGSGGGAGGMGPSPAFCRSLGPGVWVFCGGRWA